MEFRLPELGEGIDTATVVGLLIKPGDSVAAGQNILSVETDKAAVEVPIDQPGTVDKIHVKSGDKIRVGGLIATLQGHSAPKAEAKPSAASSPPPPAPNPEASQASAPPAASAPASTSSAPQKIDFKLPALGEGIENATVVGILVKPGDSVSAGQNVISVETDKAAVEVPVEVAGKVESVYVKQGDKVPVGTALLALTTAGSNEKAAPAPTGVASAPAPAGAASAPAASSPTAKKPEAVAYKTESPSTNGQSGKKEKDLTPAGPATRRLARELGVMLTEVRPSGRGGRVTLEDLKSFVRQERQSGRSANAPAFSGKTVAESLTIPALPDFSKYGTIEKKAVSKIRETIAKNLTIGWRTMPMVTQHDLADITDLEAGRKRIVDSLPKGSPKITWTVLAVKAVAGVLKEFPNFNSSYDMNSGELILKKYYHIGMAVDTERGLVVPVIRDADKKSIREIATEITTLAEKSRTGKLSLDEMRGGTFTITNLGGIGGTAFTPIVNYPEVAILGMSRSTLQPVVKDGQIVPRLMMPLSLTYDHRVIDGADGARFTSRLVQLFSDPIRLLMES